MNYPEQLKQMTNEAFAEYIQDVCRVAHVEESFDLEAELLRRMEQPSREQEDNDYWFNLFNARHSEEVKEILDETSNRKDK